MRRRAPRPAAAVLEGLVDALAPDTPLARVQRAWEQAVGAVIAHEGRPVGLRQGTLMVRCRSSVWAQELDLMAPELIHGINETVGEELVSDIRCGAA